MIKFGMHQHGNVDATYEGVTELGVAHDTRLLDEIVNECSYSTSRSKDNSPIPSRVYSHTHTSLGT
jgi:hypothetical protein